jgi:hypothetical protein
MTIPSTKTGHNKAELEEMAESVGFQRHSIDLVESNPQRI